MADELQIVKTEDENTILICMQGGTDINKVSSFMIDTKHRTVTLLRNMGPSDFANSVKLTNPTATNLLIRFAEVCNEFMEEL